MKEIKLMVVALAESYGRTLSKNVLNAYCCVLSDLSDTEVRSLFNAALIQFSRFPSPKELRELARPTDGGREIAEKIWAAIPRYGYPNGDEAREFMGPDAWAIVQNMGGWYHVCEGAYVQNKGHWIAQTRDLADSMLQRGAIERENRRAALASTDAVARLASKTVKGIE